MVAARPMYEAGEEIVLKQSYLGGRVGLDRGRRQWPHHVESARPVKGQFESRFHRSAFDGLNFVFFFFRSYKHFGCSEKRTVHMG